MTLEKILRWIVIGGVFLLPFISLYVATSLFFPYITGKNFAFRIIVEVISGAYLALALVNQAYRPRRSWILAAFALFVVVIALADAFGAYPFKSFWSNYERMDGFVTLAHLFAYFVVAAHTLRTEKLWKWLFWVMLGVSVYLSFYGLAQLFGFSTLGQGGIAGLSARIDGRFGNPIYYAVYMLFHIFIAAMLLSRVWVERQAGERLLPTLAYGSIMALNTITLCFTGTRGTILGLVGGALLAALILVILARNSRNVWRVAVGLVAGILLVAGGFWLARDSALVKEVGFLDRLATISLSESTIKARILNMGIAWQGVKERPLLGWGQEHYAIVFDKYYDPRMYGQESWFDRVHNVVFDWLVAGGFLGLFGYLAIFTTALIALWRSGGFLVAERAILTGLLAAYFFHNLTVFDNVTSYILFGTILTYIAYRSQIARSAPVLFSRPRLSAGALPIVAVIAAFLVFMGAWGINAKAIAANKALLKALTTQNVDDFEKMIAYGSFGTQEAREQLSQYATQAAQSSLPLAAKQRYFDAATTEMQLQAKASPLDARFPLFLGLTYGAFGDLNNAKLALQKALELSPQKQSILFELGQNAFLRGQGDEAVGYFKEAYEAAPQFLEPKLYYAAALIRTGKDTAAEEILAPHIATGEAADPRILAAYIERKEYERVGTIWRAHIAAQPEDVQAYFTLAAIYYQSKDPVRAIQILQAAIVAHPEVRKDAEALIEQVRVEAGN